MLEVLHRSFVRLGCLSRAERTQIATTAGFGVLLSRVQAILPGLQLSNHATLREGAGNYVFTLLSVFVVEDL